MGPLLWRDGYSLYYPGDPNRAVVLDYYTTEYKSTESSSDEMLAGNQQPKKLSDEQSKHDDEISASNNREPVEKDVVNAENGRAAQHTKAEQSRSFDLENVNKLPWAHPKRIWSTFKLVVGYGLTKDVIHHQSRGLEHVHARAPHFGNKVEHLWTTAQVCSAMIMSIAHGANDVSNAIGPFTTEYQTWRSGVASAETDTPTWIKAVGGLTLGIGFWTFGYHIMR